MTWGSAMATRSLDAQDPAPRIVRCPSCSGPSVYAATNPFRPFCSERCKTQDLSAWATERYAVEAPPARDSDEPTDNQ